MDQNTNRTKCKNTKIQKLQNTNTWCSNRKSMHLGRWRDKLGMKPTHPNRKLRLETELGKMAHKSLKRTIIVTKNVKVTIKSLKIQNSEFEISIFKS